MNKLPKVVVLLASYNGINWIDDQINSIFSQRDADISLVVSDDLSTDCTLSLLKSIKDVEILPIAKRFGSAGKNFFHLLKSVDLRGYDYVAFSDQDDIWHPEKIKRAICCLNAFSCDGYSGNVTAFYDDGRMVKIDKSQPQVQFDFLFEAAGPGCTYVFSNDLAVAAQNILSTNANIEEAISFHDWFLYALARSKGMKWYIDPQPFLLYRQHGSNSLGANHGIDAIICRLKLLHSGWYRNQITALAQVLGLKEDPFVMRALDKSIGGRFFLARNCFNVRRRRRDSLILATLSIMGWF